MKFVHKLVFSVLFLALAVIVFKPMARAFEVKPYTLPVNDFVGVLSTSTVDQLNTQLKDIAEQPGGVEVAVAILPSFEDQPLENVALAYFNDWKIGKKGLDNGVLLLLAVQDREIFIQTGYGVEGVISDGVAGRIIRNDIIPHLKNEDYDSAVKAGVERILFYTNNSDASELATGTMSDQGSFWQVMLVMVLFFGFIGFLIWWANKKWPHSGGLSKPSSTSRNFPSSFSSSKSSSSSSFSFGGGRTGGGGASGKW